MSSTPSLFDELVQQARDLGFDEVTLILSQSTHPQRFVARSNVPNKDRVALVVETVQHSFVDEIVREQGASSKLARFLSTRRQQGSGRKAVS